MINCGDCSAKSLISAGMMCSSQNVHSAFPRGNRSGPSLRPPLREAEPFRLGLSPPLPQEGLSVAALDGLQILPSQSELTQAAGRDRDRHERIVAAEEDVRGGHQRQQCRHGCWIGGPRGVVVELAELRAKSLWHQRGELRPALD